MKSNYLQIFRHHYIIAYSSNIDANVIASVPSSGCIGVFATYVYWFLVTNNFIPVI